MPRVEFDGEGVPIPSIALPPFGSETDLPPTSLTFTENADFSVADYISLGFTHYEVWCVGAAGGRGGDSSRLIVWIYETVRRAVPQSVWDLRLELLRIQDFFTSGEWDHVYYGWDPSNAQSGGTVRDMEEYFNPGHLLPFQTYKQALLFPRIEAMGGGGGGGGFHKVAGVLADLPSSIPIVVGKAGVDAPYGQTVQNGVWTPDMSLNLIGTGYPYPQSRLNELYNYFTTYLNTYPLPHSSFDVPVAGGDGGYSSFGDVGQASGGEGGAPGMVWNGAAFVVKGEGGDGGIGGRVIVGGGGAGSVVEGVNGDDGIWHPEAGIGAGGGGGKGGQPTTTTGDPRFGTYVTTTHLATAGGQGSYSFGDTSVYGQRQFRQPWTYLKPVVPLGAGTYTLVPTTDASALVIPGGGGGARPLGNLKVGSKASGYSPDGIVVLRLTKIT